MVETEKMKERGLHYLEAEIDYLIARINGSSNTFRVGWNV